VQKVRARRFQIMSDKIFFQMIYPKNLFKKIIYERNLIDIKNNEIINVYILFNLILSINHLFDWILNNEKINEIDKIKCVNIFNSYEPTDKIFSSYKKYYEKNRKISKYQ
jgi:hypothetical protein